MTDDKSTKETKRKLPPIARSTVAKSIKVKVVSNNGTSSLVEWLDDGSYLRATVANKDVVDNEVKEFMLSKATPYGIDFVEHITLTITPEIFANELHRHGVWTAEDVRLNSTTARQAFTNLAEREFQNFTRSLKKLR